MKLIVGQRVNRPDGRFYIPISRETEEPGMDSQIVARVASDAFGEDEAKCVTFARHLALSMAQCSEVLPFGHGDPELAAKLIQCEDYKWANKAYGEIVDDRRYQQFRFLEEAFELIQATQTAKMFTEEDLLRLWRYVDSRPVGKPGTEFGDVAITLNIYAMSWFTSVAHEAKLCRKGLANRTAQQLREKDQFKIQAGLI